MGVPAFFRWLSRKYPKIIIPALEDDPVYVDGVQVPNSYTEPNKNGELDNLYLDMNGIVHPCTHPEGRPAPETEDEMMVEVFKYTDRVLSLARPRKVLMIAVDGVAPRAKMNQQRSRRFRSAQDAKIAAEVEEEKLEEARRRGEEIDGLIHKKGWDTNVITPGTPFMDFLAISLRYWVAYKLNTDPGWKDLKVIISDATVPGEGEHKVMSFIRNQRCDPQYDPNTSHGIYGLDADLIFLGLATHEPHFRVLREDVFQQNKIAKDQAAHTANLDENAPKPPKPFIWLDLGILRQYLEVELDIPHQGFPFDLERAIDDWIFMAFFCGNDFLPHLPSLDVRENGIDILLWSWRKDLSKMRDYMTTDGDVDLHRVSLLLKGVASQEDDIFRKRHEQEKRREANERARKEQAKQRRRDRDNRAGNAIARGKDVAPLKPAEDIALYSTGGEVVNGKKRSNPDNEQEIKTDFKAKKGKFDESNGDGNEGEADDADAQAIDVAPEDQIASNGAKGPIQDIPAAKVEQPSNVDNVKLWEPGYHQRYYQNKFNIDPKDDIAFVKEMAHRYIEGVCWVLKYYYQGCPSWTWYYPYHYAPFAQDMTELEGLKIEFDSGEPFLPYEQLMSVLPAASSHTLPKIFRKLMAEEDSPIIDFYPENFPIDMNGKKMSWQGIALLPFIDEKRLLENVRSKYPELTQAERDRNVRKEAILLVSGESPLRKKFMDLYEDSEKCEYKAWEAHGLSGASKVDPDWSPSKPLICPVQSTHLPDLEVNNSISVEYLIDENSMHKSMLMQGVKLPENVLTPEQMEIIIHRRNKSDRRDERFDRREEARFQATDGFAEPRQKRDGGYTAFLEESLKQRDYQSSYGQGYGDSSNYSQGRGQWSNQGYGSYNNYGSGGYGHGSYGNGAYGSGAYGNGGHGNGGYGQYGRHQGNGHQNQGGNQYNDGGNYGGYQNSWNNHRSDHRGHRGGGHRGRGGGRGNWNSGQQWRS